MLDDDAIASDLAQGGRGRGRSLAQRACRQADRRSQDFANIL